MAAGAFVPYDSFVYRMARGDILFLSDTIRAALVDNSYTPSATLHDAWDDVVAYECTDLDYSQKTLTNKQINQDGSYRTVFDDTGDLDFGDTATISARYLVLYKYTGVDATSYLIGYIDLNSGGSTNVSSTNDDFDIAWSADGIYRIDP